MIALVYNLFDLSNGCYFGVIEAYGNTLNYVDWIENPSTIFTSLAFNFGFIYTNVRDLVMAALGDERSPIDSAYGLGLAIGQLYYFLMIVEYFFQ
jgi:hypothetical protein